jgi:Ricin-type beta-trefoil lectin domain-like
MVNGGTAQQWDYVGSPSQLWQITPTYSGYFKLINYRSGLALTVPYPLTQSGIQLQQYTYNGTKNQQWLFDEVNPLITGSNYAITARHSGKSMNPTSMYDLATVVQAPTLDNYVYQKWTATTQGGAIQAFTNAGTNRLLQVGRTNPGYKYGQENGEEVTQKAYTGDAWQKWTVVAVDLEGGDFWYRLVNVGSGLSADIGGVSTLDNAPVSQYSYQGGPNQHWRFKLAP